MMGFRDRSWKERKLISQTWSFCYLSEREGPAAVFELVLHGSQLSEFGEVGEGLQPPDGFAELLLVFHDEKLQQTQHLHTHTERQKSGKPMEILLREQF